MLTLHPQTLRLYERKGLIRPSRTDGRTRVYSAEDVEEIRLILRLSRDLGVNLAGIEIILRMRRQMLRCRRSWRQRPPPWARRPGAGPTEQPRRAAPGAGRGPATSQARCLLDGRANDTFTTDEAPGQRAGGAEGAAPAKRAELVAKLREEREGRRRRRAREKVEGMPFGDRPALSPDDEMGFAVADRRAEMLAQIDLALKKLEEGNYGRCEACEEEINAARLRAHPFAVRCTRCQEIWERDQSRAETGGPGRAARGADASRRATGADRDQAPSDADIRIETSPARRAGEHRAPRRSKPDELAILPLRESVLFPQAVIPLAVARPSSVRAVDEAVLGAPPDRRAHPARRHAGDARRPTSFTDGHRRDHPPDAQAARRHDPAGRPGAGALPGGGVHPDDAVPPGPDRARARRRAGGRRRGGPGARPPGPDALRADRGAVPDACRTISWPSSPARATRAG